MFSQTNQVQSTQSTVDQVKSLNNELERLNEECKLLLNNVPSMTYAYANASYCLSNFIAAINELQQQTIELVQALDNSYQIQMNVMESTHSTNYIHEIVKDGFANHKNLNSIKENLQNLDQKRKDFFIKNMKDIKPNINGDLFPAERQEKLNNNLLVNYDKSKAILINLLDKHFVKLIQKINGPLTQRIAYGSL